MASGSGRWPCSDRHYSFQAEGTSWWPALTTRTRINRVAGSELPVAPELGGGPAGEDRLGCDLLSIAGAAESSERRDDAVA